MLFSRPELTTGAGRGWLAATRITLATGWLQLDFQTRLTLALGQRDHGSLELRPLPTIRHQAQARQIQPQIVTQHLRTPAHRQLPALTGIAADDEAQAKVRLGQGLLQRLQGRQGFGLNIDQDGYSSSNDL